MGVLDHHLWNEKAYAQCTGLQMYTPGHNTMELSRANINRTLY